MRHLAPFNDVFGTETHIVQFNVFFMGPRSGENLAFGELRTHFSSKKWPLSSGALRAQFISNVAARYARKGRAGGLGAAAGALRAHFDIGRS